MPVISLSVACATTLFTSIIGLTPNYHKSDKPLSLLLSAPKGSTYSYEMSATTTMGSMSGRMSMLMDMKILSVDTKGLRTFENKSHSGRFIQGENSVEMPGSVTQSVIKPNGELVSSKPASSAPSQSRARRMMQIIVSEKPLSVGATWSWNDPASELNGHVPAKGVGTLKSSSKRGGIECAHVSITITETSGDKPMQSKMDAWISLDDGMLISNDVTITNFAASPTQVGTLHMTVNRVKK